MSKNSFYYWGRVAADGSPTIINRDLFWEHVHILGNSGSGKSSMRLAPLVEQTIGFGDTSLIFIDLKADKLENLAACFAAKEELKHRTGIDLPIRVFTLQLGKPSHIFNPFLTGGLNNMSFADRVSLITEPLGLFYGLIYGQGHFSALNSATVRECLVANPGISSFHELYCAMMTQAMDWTSYVGSQHRKDYIQVAETVLSLAGCNVLNVTHSTPHSQEALENQIDLAAAFQSPAIYYFHLPSVTSPFVAQTIGRLVVKYLLIAADAAPRKVKVQVVIDEFQQMISDNLDIVFQQARGRDIGMVIANQSIGDLRNVGPVLLSAIEGNCAIRQWLSVTTAEDIEHLAKLFGTRKEFHRTITESTERRSVSRTLRDEPRITVNCLHQVSSDPFLSVTQIKGERGGFAQYRGVPFVVRNAFHISHEEYLRRLGFQWPPDLPGMVVVNELPVPPTPTMKKQVKSRPEPSRDKATVTSKQDQKAMDDMFVPTTEVSS
ncbi:type IV secretory system conjugative DNA transfer family protein [Gimesia maris]|uniref:type IV secretory system conjugative DNA transfer family protein n=1 Tax=Gimesia maris TaxID=122 RepID=UPI003A959327